jgi:GPI inositol-deacylase
MGGIVATSLLDTQSVQAIITMSTPHRLPPARFDHRVDRLYDYTLGLLANDPTPVVSLCGGATDMMIPSESCILPPPSNTSGSQPFRTTIFTSGLEGAWTGVGHQEMVWCHQVRWRVARVILEMAAVPDVEKGAILDKWLRDGHTLPPLAVEGGARPSLTDPSQYEALPVGINLVMRRPRGKVTYLLPVPERSILYPNSTFILYASQGTIAPVGPAHPNSLRVAVSLCTSSSPHASEDTPITCGRLAPSAHRLIPNPPYRQIFPAPRDPFIQDSGGVDESDGVVLFEAEMPKTKLSDYEWVALDIESPVAEGWVVGGFNNGMKLAHEIKTTRKMMHHHT